jgi:trehalose-6-phosphate synthase
MITHNIHIGNLVLQKLKEKKRSVAWFANEIGIDPSNLRKRLKKQSMDTKLLQLISKTLQCSFFQHLDSL